MAIQHVNAVSNRLSLRPPQRESLEILARVCESVSLVKDADPMVALQAIRSEFPTVEDFEREFPSLCFALATGVGKTRLMGASIAYLYQAEGIRNFFVLAPNLTIYNKLIADFTPNTPKYVFKGIGEFTTNPPVIITGETYESVTSARGHLFDIPDDCHINIFNISKINSEVRGGKSPRIKRLSEYIGQSYFDYLAGLDDLVMLMDESHRYRATAGVRAINELKPILGLELTATPQVETGGRSVPFKNVIYSYPLASAMDDGFVKEPAVATRENFDPNAYSAEGLEKVKLEDGVRIHENTKVELEVYARNNDKPIVKPFMLVVATDTTHANALQQVIEGETFFEGRYKGRVIQVHSNIRGEEKDDVVQQLLTVEAPDNPVEIVIHVNMLKEGWDVTNLYTIVPLRAANSRTLVEQSIGRGLRLPYGKRVGVPAVDRLTIVSHDKFQEIVDHANDPNSIIRTGVVIGRDILGEGRKALEIKSAFEQAISGDVAPFPATGRAVPEQRKLFEKPEEQEVAKATYQIIKQYERLKGSDQLQDAEIQREIVQKVQEIVRPAQGVLEGIVEAVNVAEVVQKTTELYCELSIDVPKIVVVPKGEVTCRYEDFDLDVRNINYPPVEDRILIQHLHEDQRYRLQDGSGIIKEKRPEDYLVRGLIDFDDVSYDEHAGLLYKLAGQVVARLREYLTDEDDVINVLQYHQQTLVNLIHSQMQQHFVESASAYEAHVTRGFHTLRANNYSAAANEDVRDFRVTVPEGQRNRISSMVFGGFHKCLYPAQKFDSDPERRFAVLVENEDDVLKWFKPAKGDLQIHYSHEDSYEPDFVVETKTEKLLCEPKRANEVTDEVVLAKADAAATWCKHATAHANENGGKPWRYLLIPHDQIQDQMTLATFAARCEVYAKD
ncbi:DEAD/DEAH box helicase family protein [Anaerobaca lacustris]|uniref:DEAD/DEAH box helicase family protein n=1 Tax=Anaerobaca lacustris TaxID=3044600 RepID=A0AAW6U8Q9_9BACT|nr:DEAD/DEAH box helicase family protein [Sedimentisphaerales bacterium M17dextr]